MKKAIPAITLSLLTGCASVPVQNLAPPLSVTRSPARNHRWQVEIKTRPDFGKELSYVEARRRAAGVPAGGGAVGLAFSGGGLRSATINLGVLQGLQEKGILKKADYLSCVSGGAYIGAWYVAHLTNKTGSPAGPRESANAQYTSNPDRLLGTGPFRNNSDSIKGLENERGFVLGKANTNIPKILGIMALTIPVNAVMDVGLHFKPTRGKFNWHHPNFFYDYYIRKTYLSEPVALLPNQNPLGDFHKGEPHSLALEEINPAGSAAPYLIVNCALANARPGIKPWSAETLPFEFSRFSCGSMPLGFVPAEDFGFPVEGTYQKDGKRYSVLRTNSLANLPVVKPFKLSSAVAASGAALDASGFKEIPNQDPQTGVEINAPTVATKRMWLDFVLKPLNLNLRHQNRNFAMAITDWRENATHVNSRQPLDWVQPKHDVQDRLREVTTDRFNSSVFSDALYLSDGAHYENLGIFALTLRPEIRTIWCIDAGQDGSYEFSDIVHLSKLLDYSGWDVNWQKNSKDTVCGTNEFPECENFSKKATAAKSGAVRPWKNPPVFKATLTHKGRKSITLYYVKSSYRENDGADDESKRFLKDYYQGNKESGIRRHLNLPHTSTANLSFSENDFRAYREIGRVLGHALANTQ